MKKKRRRTYFGAAPPPPQPKLFSSDKRRRRPRPKLVDRPDRYEIKARPNTERLVWNRVALFLTVADICGTFHHLHRNTRFIGDWMDLAIRDFSPGMRLDKTSFPTMASYAELMYAFLHGRKDGHQQWLLWDGSTPFTLTCMAHVSASTYIEESITTQPIEWLRKSDGELIALPFYDIKGVKTTYV